MSAPIFREDAAAARFEVLVDGQLAGFAAYRAEGDTLTFHHTEIDAGYEGRGLGSGLARHALDTARGRGQQVLPACSFIAGTIRRHPGEYLDLVPPAQRARYGL